MARPRHVNPRKRTRKPVKGAIRKYRRRNRYRMNRNRNRRLIRFSRVLAPNGIPSKMLIKFRYYGKLTTAMTSGDASIEDVRTLRWNSIFQPDISTNVHPYYHNQWKALYSRYLVTSCKVKVHLRPIRSYSNYEVACFLSESKDNIVSDLIAKNFLESIALPDVKWRSLRYSNNSTLTDVFTLRRVTNIKDIWDNESLYGAAFDANPSHPLYCHIDLKMKQDSENLTSNFELFYTLTQKTILYERKDDIDPSTSGALLEV